jgi:hypothetical protein
LIFELVHFEALGSYPLQAIADELNTNGFRTAQGKLFAPMQVKRVLDRAVD